MVRGEKWPKYNIVVDYVSEGDIANLMRGYVDVEGERIRFRGVAYGRFGGQNVYPELSPSARKRLSRHFGDVSKFEEDLQLRLVRGDFEVRQSGKERHHHEHLQG
jgi:hypothetical protein